MAEIGEEVRLKPRWLKSGKKRDKFEKFYIFQIFKKIFICKIFEKFFIFQNFRKIFILQNF